MPPEHDSLEDTAAESAAATTAPDTAPPQAQTDSTQGPTSLLDAALSALAPEAREGQAEEAKADPANSEKPEDDASGAQPAAEADDIPRIPDEQFRALPKEVRTVVNKLRQRVDALAPAAERVAKLDEFMRESNLTPDEFVEGQDVMALMKRDPRAALQKLEKHVANLRAYLGVELPDDLRQEVEDGYITEERARELSQARANERHVRAVSEADSQRRTADESLRAVQAWEQAAAGSDPDFALKLPMVMDKARIATAQLGRPVKGPDEALAIVRKAYEETNAMLRSFQRAPTATLRSPSSSAAAPPSRAQPKDIYQAAALALGGGA